MGSLSPQSRPVASPDGGGPRYVANRLVVKFRSEGPTPLAHSAHELLAADGTAAALASCPSLARLNQACRLQSVRGLFFDRRGLATADARATQDRLVERIRDRYPARSRRAPGTPLPDLTNYYVLEFEEGADARAFRPHYQADSFVESAELDSFGAHHYTPNDPFFHSRGSWGQDGDDLWGLKRIQADRAWDVTMGEGVVVAVIDTGIDYNHPDVAANVWTNAGEIPDNGVDDDGNGYIDDVRGWNFADGNNDPMDRDSAEGHGTHVAGIIAAVADNGLGIVGVAPRAKVMALKHAGASGDPVSSASAQAVLYAVANGADIINNSWTLGNPSPALLDAIRFAHALGVVVIFAVGNDGTFLPHAGLPTLRETIKVAATFPDDSHAPFSNWGKFVDVAAPGGGSPSFPAAGAESNPLHSALSLRAAVVHPAIVAQYGVGDGYLRMFGTSVAAPHVAGLAALILARRPDLTNEGVRQVLRASADPAGDPGFNFRTGYGRINAARALEVEGPPHVHIREPAEGLVLGPEARAVRVCGAVAGPLLEAFQLYYSRLGDLTHRQPIGPPACGPAEGQLHTWDVGELPMGVYLLRLVATNRDGRTFEDTVQVIRPNDATVSLADDPALRGPLAVAGRWVAWAQTPANSDETQMVLLDVQTGERKVIAQGKVPPVVVGLSEDCLVYDFSDDAGTTLRRYDLGSGQETPIAVVAKADAPPSVSPFKNLAVSGNKVAWVQIDANMVLASIRAYDASTGETKTVETGPSVGDGGIALDGDRLARVSNFELVLDDLASGTSQSLTPDEPLGITKSLPALSGEDVVWLEQPALSERLSIRHHSLRTGATRALREDLDVAAGLAISGGKVVWTDARNGNPDVYLYDLGADAEVAVTAGFETRGAPAVSGNRVVWLTAAGGQTNVDLFEIPLS